MNNLDPSQTYRLLSSAEAPEGVRDTLAGIERKQGAAVSNTIRVLAASPAAFQNYISGGANLGRGLFSKVEQELLAVTISAHNDCAYCVAAHSTLALSAGMAPEILAAARKGRTLPDPKLEALSAFMKALLAGQGWVRQEDQDAFFKAGYSPAQAVEAVAWIAQMTLTNYLNHLADTPLDGKFQAQAWSADELEV